MFQMGISVAEQTLLCFPYLFQTQPTEKSLLLSSQWALIDSKRDYILADFCETNM